MSNSTAPLPTKDKPESTFTHISNWGGNIISVVSFLVWTVQLFRCGYYYTVLYKHNRDNKTSFIKGLLMFITHLSLMIANILYLVYETDITDTNPIPVVFYMMFSLNFASVISFRMMTF